MPFRVNYFEILIIAFIFTIFINNYNENLKYKIKNELKLYILLIWGWFFLSVFSGLGIIFYPQGPYAYSFYYKYLLQLFIHSFFFTYFIIYLSSITAKKRNMLIVYFVAMVVLSSFYGILQLFLKLKFGIDIDENISKFLGHELASGEYIDFERYAYGYLSRINGLTGDPSVHAAYTIMAIPFLLLRFITSNNKYFLYLIFLIVIFVSLVLTMSGSGSVGFVISMVLILLLRLRICKLKYRHIMTFIIIVGFLFSFYKYFQEDFLYYLPKRFDPQGSIRSHLNIAEKSINIGLKYPLGVGANNFSIAYENQYGIVGYNPHNNWIGYFVENGFLGLFYKIIFSVFIIISCLKRKTYLSSAFIASYIGMCVAALGYQTLNLFGLQLYVALFFSCVMLEQNQKILTRYNVKNLNGNFLNLVEHRF